MENQLTVFENKAIRSGARPSGCANTEGGLTHHHVYAFSNAEPFKVY